MIHASNSSLSPYRHGRRLRRWLLLLSASVCLLAGLWILTSWLRGGGDTEEVPPAPETTVVKGTTLAESAELTVIQRESGARLPSATDEMVVKFDPAADDWDTESLHDLMDRQLKKLAALIEQFAGGETPAHIDVVAEEFSCQRLWPRSLKTVYDDDVFTVQQQANDIADVTASDARGSQCLLEALRPLINDLVQVQRVSVKLKQVGIQQMDHGVITRVLYNAHGHTSQQGIQQRAAWQCTWSVAANHGRGTPLLTSIQADDFEQVTIRTAGGRLFADATAAVLAKVPHYRDQILRGIDHWLPRIPKVATSMWYLGYHGLAVGDVNGDGLEDLYACETGGLPNRLYLQNEDGTVRDASDEAGLDWLDYSTSAIFADLDNDGDQDLVVSLAAGVVFAENNGQGRFELRSGERYVTEPQSLSATDYDLDGDLDIYLCGYLPYEEIKQLPMPIPYHDANNGGRNALLRNEGDFQFNDVTREVGLDVHNRRFTFAAAWEDYDNDGDQDLYVANDFGRNCLYRNHNGRFTDVAATAGVEDVASGMSVSFADYNRDGQMDLYVSNMFSAAGQRISFQRRFAPGSSEQERQNLQRMARGNTLFTNLGNGTFRDDSLSAGVTMGRWAWASSFADLNNDSLPDIVVANGFVTSEGSGDL